MRGADTNVIARLLLADDLTQLAAVTRISEQARDEGELFYLTSIVVCELVWILESTYSQTRVQICEALDRVLEFELFRFEHEALVRRALELFRGGRADFSDYLIGEICREAGCRDTVTFDRDLRGAEGYSVLY